MPSSRSGRSQAFDELKGKARNKTKLALARRLASESSGQSTRGAWYPRLMPATGW